MTNIATLLKNEIARVARREVRTETTALKKAVSGYRSEIAALKRRAQELEQQVRRLAKSKAKTPSLAQDAEEGSKLRFSAKGFASHRQRLGISAHDCGLLLGASGQSIYKWEDGSVRPRAKHLAAIAEFRGLGKKEVAARLDGLR